MTGETADMKVSEESVAFWIDFVELNLKLLTWMFLYWELIFIDIVLLDPMEKLGLIFACLCL